MNVKIGLEIHQRLDTKKLHCNCYANPSEEKTPFIVQNVLHRRLKAVGGESGEVDVAARFEASKRTLYEYLIDENFSCLVESDEQPPLPLRQETLLIVLGVVKALNAHVVDEVHVMRKIIADGSAVSGFQRTSLVATGGFIETSKGKVGIQTIALEEDSAGIIEKKPGKFVYRLDRLGIPLIEIATEPDIVDGVHAKEVAEKLGNILRSAKVQRGLGSIRQDLNVSIDGGERVELKGVQDLKLLPKIIDHEISRQKSEGVKKGGETRRISGESSEFMRPLAGAARIYPETDVPHVKISKELSSSAVVGESLDSKIEGLKKLGLGEQMAQRLAPTRDFEVFERLRSRTSAEPLVIASTLLETMKSLKREGVETDKISEDSLVEALVLLETGRITKAALQEVIRFLPAGLGAEETAEKHKLFKFSSKELDALVAGGKSFAEIMREHRLRVDAGELQAKLKR